MKSFMKKKVLPLILLSVLVIATGCQSIGGVDLNKMLVNQIMSDSMEGTMDLTLHLVPDQSAEADPETLEMIEAINGMQVVVESFKQQDLDTMSAIGKLIITRGEIPFQLSMSQTEMVMQIEGADAPIIVPLDSATNPLSDYTNMGDTDELTIDPLQEKALMESLASLIVNHLENPEDITVQRVTENIHGESLSLYKIHSDIKGPEMLTLLKKFLRNLVMDDQAMKLFIAQLYDVMKENATEEDDILYGLGLGFGSTGSADRELEIEFIHTFIKQGLLIFLMMLEDESMVAEFDPILNDDTYLRSDLFVDNSLHVRKSDFELSISPEVADQEDLEGISSVQIEGHGQFWNHDKAVTADILTYEDEDALYMADVTSFDDDFISILDQESVLFKLLKEDLHATRKTAIFYTVDDYEFMPYELAIVKNGIMTVPARSLADNLGLQLDWNGVTRELILTSPFDGTTVAFKVDSNKATVNGTDETMPLATFISNGQTYIPLRFVTDAIGAEIEWIQETSTAIVTIE
ncbi:MAG: copper amine oxidase N-terminal domain-containing protein [Paenibacillaceae bacterium]